MNDKTVTVRRSVLGWSAYDGDDMYNLIASAESLDLLTSSLTNLGVSEFTVKVLPEERTEPWPEPKKKKKKAKQRRALGSGSAAA